MTVPLAPHRRDRWPMLAWWWRRWRARHDLAMAEMIYRRRPNVMNRAARDRAGDRCREIDTARP